MVIDLDKIPLGIAESQSEVNILRSGLIYKEMRKVNERYDYNKLTVSMSVYNVLINHDKFYNHPFPIIDAVTEVGIFCGFKVFMDLTLQENVILASYDLTEKRDDVIASILENKEIKKDLKIKVLNC